MNSRTEFGANSVPRISAQQPTDSTNKTQTQRRIRDPSADVPTESKNKRQRTETDRDRLAPPTEPPMSPRNTPRRQYQDPPASSIHEQSDHDDGTRLVNSDGTTESTEQEQQRNSVIANMSQSSINSSTRRTIRNQAELGLLYTNITKEIRGKSGIKCNT